MVKSKSTQVNSDISLLSVNSFTFIIKFSRKYDL